MEGLGRQLSRRPLLALMGGEPLLVKERVLEVARSAGRRWEKLVSTNGMLIDDGFTRQAKTVGLSVQVSIDGATADSHERLRGKGTFEVAIGVVRRLVGAGVHTVMSMVAHDENQEEIAASLDLAMELGVNEARIIPLKRVGAGKDTSLRMPNLRGLLGSIVKAIQKRPERKDLLGRDYLSLLAQTCGHSYRRTTCGTASQTILLDADGSVYPCQNSCAAEFVAGNIRRDSWADIWQSDTLVRFRQVCDVDKLSACRSCSLRYCTWVDAGARHTVLAAEWMPPAQLVA